jgi:hypothetical protein
VLVEEGGDDHDETHVRLATALEKMRSITQSFAAPGARAAARARLSDYFFDSSDDGDDSPRRVDDAAGEGEGGGGGGGDTSDSDDEQR